MRFLNREELFADIHGPLQLLPEGEEQEAISEMTTGHLMAAQTLDWESADSGTSHCGPVRVS